MLNITILIILTALGIAEAQPEAVIQSARQSPYSPYFDAAVYPHGWGWPIAAFVLIVLKAALLFGAYVVAAFSEFRLFRKPGARSSVEFSLWTNAMLDSLSVEPQQECRKRLLCEAEVSIRNNALLRIVAYAASEKTHQLLDCGELVSRKRCSVTIGDLILRKIGWFGD
ncbi:uncharacterized protein LOC131692400 [Topomyia yanbarensis]|uniref:uncharacterized protein LOC131692400 n=1 Tax=Topomyia yanbarensis TaxID=2498891 RepID=UPI00273BC3CF|nr:uncharacterized protein LOC131692400 [Topomyia yanbarensis]